MTLILLGLLAGCMGEDRFQARYDEELCLWRADCFGDDFELCLDESAEDWSGSGCEFNRGEAKQCLKELKYMDCPTETWDAGLPLACGLVWEC